jgi:haloacetate dehalogenase
MFDGFTSAMIEGSETTIFVRTAGNGPPLLLLHGFPETHLMWHRVAPALAEHATVVCADLRGYGSSGTPPSTDDHRTYSKRALAADMVELMTSLGFDRFGVIGHDRGARVAYRMALDHPRRVDRLAVLDAIPISEAIARADARLARDYWPWWLLAQPGPLPERLIAGDPAAIIDDATGNWGSSADRFPPEVRAAYVDALRSPDSVHAICEEYRAALSVDVDDDLDDRRLGRRIICPTLVLWSQGGPLDVWYADAGGPLGIWAEWAEEVSGHTVPGGHFFPEHNPTATTGALQAFFLPT